MVNKWVSKSEFARRAKVTPAAVTKALKSTLFGAYDGRRIDLNHPAALEYVYQHDPAKTRTIASGFDPLYEQAVELCREANKFIPAVIIKELGIGTARARRIIDCIRATGMHDSNTYTPQPEKIDGRTKEIRKGERPVLRGWDAKKRNDEKDLPLNPLTYDDIPEEIREFIDMSLRDLVKKFGTSTGFGDWLKATKQIEDIHEKRLKNAQTKGELVNIQMVKIGVIDQVNSAHMKMLTDGAKTINKRVRAMTEAGRDEQETEKFIIDQISSFIKPMKTKISKALRDA